jgi:hypothetical protein
MPPVDRNLESYVSTLEAALSRIRGRSVTLSPRDFALARGWFEAGIPAERVREALERAQSEGQSPSGLAYVQRQVEGRPGRLGSRRSEQPEGSEAGAPALAQLQAALARLPESAAASFAGVRRALERTGTEPTPEALDELDRALDAAALDAVPEPELQRWRADAARARTRQAHLPPAALDEAERRALTRRARERWGLPYVSTGS